MAMVQIQKAATMRVGIDLWGRLQKGCYILKAMFKKIKSVYAEVYKNYLFTMILTDITTVLFMVYVVGKHHSETVLWLCLFFLYWTFGSFCAECFKHIADNKDVSGKNGRIKAGVGIAVTGGISALLVSLNTGSILGTAILLASPIKGNRLITFSLAYFILILLSSFYIVYEDQRNKVEGLSFEKYFVHVFTEIFQTCIAWTILSVGFLLLSLVFETLIDPVVGEIEIPQILIMGLFVAPKMFMSLSASNGEIGRFFEILIRYVMLIITIVGAGIIYLYMIKVIFNGIPSNEIFGITAALFLVAIPVGFACTAFDKNSFLQKIAYALPYIYAPFIILQIYSIVLRLSEYGTTPSRYAGMVLIVLEILYIVFYAFFRKHINKLILVMMCITVVATLVPGVNAIDVSNFSQKSILADFVKNGMPDSETAQKRIKGAYDYLVNAYDEDYVEKIVDDDLMNQLTDLKLNNNTIEIYRLLTDVEMLPTHGYDYVAKMYSTCDSFDGKDASSNMEVKIMNGTTVATCDFTQEYKSVIERDIENGGTYTESMDVIKLSDDCELVLDDVIVTYDTGDDTLVDLKIYGYVLMNQNYVDELNLAGELSGE